jgi:hypothetical protein
MPRKKLKIFIQKEARCKLCNCDYVEEINSLILQKKTGKEIYNWLKNNGVVTSETAVKRHRRLHCFIVEAGKSPPAEYRPDEVLPEDFSPKQFKDVSQFLDDIIMKANSRLQNNEINVTMADALKAAEIKSRTVNDDKTKADVINFFLEVANVNVSDNSNKTVNEG